MHTYTQVSLSASNSLTHAQITKEKWPELLALDELTREMAAGRVLCGYTALEPLFPPTFKRIREIGERASETERQRGRGARSEERGERREEGEPRLLY